MIPHVWIGFFVNLFFALLAYGAKSVTLSGALGGLLLGTWIYGFMGLRGFLIVAAFFILASFFTRVGYAVKKKRGTAQRRGGRRTHREAFANCLIGATLATLFFFTGNFLYEIAFIASFATALADTTATELGSLYGKTAFSVPSFKNVPAGTKGAISLEGTVLGMVAASLLSYFAYTIGLIQKQDILFVVSGATIGFLAESFLAKLSFVGHETRNFLNTLFGAIAAASLVYYLS